MRALSNVFFFFTSKYKHAIMVVFVICYKVKTRNILLYDYKKLTLTLKHHFRSRYSLSQHCWDTLLSSRLSNVGVQGELTTINNIGRERRQTKEKKKKTSSRGVSTNSVWDCSQFGTCYNLNKGAKCNRDLVTDVKWVQMF